MKTSEGFATIAGLLVAVALGVGIGWTSHADQAQRDRCYRDEPCPFGPGVVGRRICSGGLLAEKCSAPEPERSYTLTASSAEVEKACERVLNDRGLVHMHLADGTCVGPGCEAPEGCVPPKPPAYWADGGYERMLKRIEAGLPSVDLDAGVGL